MRAIDQPLSVLPDLTDDSLVLSVLNKETQNTALDYSLEGSDFTTVTDVGWEKVGARFNGTSSVMSTTAQVLKDDDCFVSLWVNPASVASGMIFRGLGAGTNRFYLGLNAGTLYVTRGTNDFNATTTILANQWTHVCVYWESSTNSVLLYKNGALADSGTYTPVGGAGDATMTLAYDGAGTYLDCQIKMLNIYSSIKSADWVAHEFHRSVPASDLVLHVTSGLEDHSRFKHTLTNNGATLGGRMRFDGSSYIDVGDNTSLDITTAIAISAWVKPALIAGSLRSIATRDDSVNQNYALYLNAAGNAMMYVYIGGVLKSVTGDTAFSLNQWYNVFGVYDGAYVRIYVNGVEDKTPTAATGSIDNDDVSLTIGAREDGVDRFFNGMMDDLKLFSTPPSASFIKQYYEMTKGLF